MKVCVCLDVYVCVSMNESNSDMKFPTHSLTQTRIHTHAVWVPTEFHRQIFIEGGVDAERLHVCVCACVGDYVYILVHIHIYIYIHTHR